MPKLLAPDRRDISDIDGQKLTGAPTDGLNDAASLGENLLFSLPFSPSISLLLPFLSLSLSLPVEELKPLTVESLSLSIEWLNPLKALPVEELKPYQSKHSRVTSSTSRSIHSRGTKGLDSLSAWGKKTLSTGVALLDASDQ